MAPISVLVVDDSVVVRRLVSDVLSADPGIEVVGSASNGRIALAKIPLLNPDLVTLDVEMPVMDGIETLIALREAYPALPVIMFSTLTERGASATLDALERGANDYVTKPANVGGVTASMEAVRSELIPKIKYLVPHGTGSTLPRPAYPRPATPSLSATPASAPAAPLPARPLFAPARADRVDVLVIGVSTGGPDALTTLISALPDSFPVPIAIVQHMPPIFTSLFARRLDSKSRLAVKEAQAGDRMAPGQVLLAPGDFHLRLRASGDGTIAQLDQGAPENYCRPAVDVLFRSAAEAYGSGVLGVVLTGMGSDGTRGAARIVEAGGSMVAQDEPTSVVWGMPGSLVGAGLASQVLPLAAIAGAVERRVALGRTPAGIRGGT